MPITFVDTAPALRTIAIPFTFTLWSAINQSVAISATTDLTANQRILGAWLEKSTGLSTGTLRLGHGSVAAHRETLGTGAECDAVNPGTVELTAWRNSTDGVIVGGFNNLLIAANRAINARFEGASLPTTGAFVLYLLVHDVQGRAVL